MKDYSPQTRILFAEYDEVEFRRRLLREMALIARCLYEPLPDSAGSTISIPSVCVSEDEEEK
jgi:hypothetical protein